MIARQGLARCTCADGVNPDPFCDLHGLYGTDTLLERERLIRIGALPANFIRVGESVAEQARADLDGARRDVRRMRLVARAALVVQVAAALVGLAVGLRGSLTGWTAAAGVALVAWSCYRWTHARAHRLNASADRLAERLDSLGPR